MIPFFVLVAIYYGQGVLAGDPQEWQRWCAIALFIGAAASDGIDGYIARHYNQRSRLGAILDPIADKGLLLAALLTLTFSNWSNAFPIWFPVLVIARDLILVTGATMLRHLNGSVDVNPSWSGKIATVMQMIAITLAMLQFDFLRQPIEWLPQRAALLWIDVTVIFAGLFTVISGVGYVVDGIGQLQAKGHGDPVP